MSDTPEIIAAAEKLGLLVSQHPAVMKYKDAQKSVTADPEASRLMAEFARQLETLARQEQSGAPMSDVQRQQLESLQTRIASNLKVKSLNMAEYEFTDLLRRVSQTWQKPLAPNPEAGAAPTQMR